MASPKIVWNANSEIKNVAELITSIKKIEVIGEPKERLVVIHDHL